MSTGTLNSLVETMIFNPPHAGPAVEERPAVHPADPSDKPLHPLTEDPRYIG